MFENIIGQNAASQLRVDVESGRLAPSVLFFGPVASGKGSAALELARVLSCEANGAMLAAWNCSCPSCMRHRQLLHGDLLLLGNRNFSAEIAAARSAFLREPASPATLLLFIRSVRKLTARFSPVLWENDPKLGKISPLIQTLEEALGEFDVASAGAATVGAAATEKLLDAIQKAASKLEDEGCTDTIPVAHIRRAAWWARLAPNGRRKTLVIENAGDMQDGARNSLLKILEEPPASLQIILCTQRREDIIHTLLSRLRPYRFLKRESEKESEVLRRVFRDTSAATVSAQGGIAAYLDSFLPQSDEKLNALAALFIACLARTTAISLKRAGSGITGELAALGAHCTPIAEAAGFGRCNGARELNATLLEESSGFQSGSFSRFLSCCLALVSQSLQKTGANPRAIHYYEVWRKNAAEADAATGVWNQNTALVLEGFFFKLKNALTA